MTVGLTAPLLTAAILGMCFGPTRWLGISATSLVTLHHPWLVIVVITITAAMFYVLKLRK